MDGSHLLYVKTAPGAAETTLALLRYVAARLPALRRMGAAPRVNRVSDRALASPEVLRAFAARGITGLPALLAGGKVYVGLSAIVGAYDRNLRALAEGGGGAGGASAAADDEGDPLEAFYRREVSGAGGPGAAGDEDEVGEGGGRMLDDLQRHVEARKARAPPPLPGGARGAGTPPPPSPGSSREGGRGAAAPPGRRPDNVAPPGARGRPAPAAEPDDEFQATLDLLARDIDGDLREKAFASSTPYDEEGGGDDPKDRLMERAYYANREDSIRGGGSP